MILQKRLSAMQEKEVERLCKTLGITHRQLIENALIMYLDEHGSTFPRSEPRGGDRHSPFAHGLNYARSVVSDDTDPEVVYKSLDEEAAKRFPDDQHKQNEFTSGAVQALAEIFPDWADAYLLEK